ncbi:hypothetical protein THERMOS_509 [Bathymodiolus thermophilus thioautotrophic gill symbiont]|uniref:Uncharacterized protein n=1 Tax=Bathymodiolus thermophilus thioautotrophic gill symbiont TaxID=2360 RepID=A0A8H9CGV3_9GAMM|nr:hypothetical protein THERMOS_509 [Bathymodiolus thermophilus thioautotrophic gill symbiont]
MISKIQFYRLGDSLKLYSDYQVGQSYLRKGINCIMRALYK